MAFGEWMTVQDVAAQLEVRIETVRRWIRSGELPVLELGGSRTVYRIRREDLDQFVIKRYPERARVDAPAASDDADPGTALVNDPVSRIDTLPGSWDDVVVPDPLFESTSHIPSPRIFVDHVPAITFREKALDSTSSTFMSREIETLLGVPAEHFTGNPGYWRTLIHPEDRQAVEDELARTDATGDPFVMEYRMLRHNGESVWVRVEASLTNDIESDGQVWEGVLEDVTERRILQAALESRERQQTAIAELGRLSLEGGTVSSLLKHAVQLIVDALDVESARAFEVLPGGKLLKLRAHFSSVNGDANEDGYDGVPDVDTLSEYALSISDAVTSSDLTQEARFDGPGLARRAGACSGAAVIVPWRFRPFGVLTVLSRQPRRFTRDDVHFLQSMANVIASVATTSNDQWLTVTEVADFLQVTEETVRRWIRHSELPALNLGGARAGYRVYPSDLERFIQERLIH